MIYNNYELVAALKYLALSGMENGALQWIGTPADRSMVARDVDAYERTLENFVECDTCNDDGYVEIMGDGGNFECDVIGTKPCPDCRD
jgi:hypothetical protein